MRWRTISPTLRRVPGRRLACVLLCGGVALLLGCERSVKVPTLRGRVVDARTGNPIVGAVVRTQDYRAGASNLEAARLIRGSKREATTGEDGRFELPGFVGKQISGIGWLAYAPGYMVGSGCYSEEGWPPGGCSGFGLTDATDPWVRTSWEKGSGGVEVTLRLFPRPSRVSPSTRGCPSVGGQSPFPRTGWRTRYPNGLPDPSEEQFRRLGVLSERGPITQSEYLNAAIEYLDSSVLLTDGVAFRLLRLVGAPIPGHPMEEDHDPAVKAIRLALLTYCREQRAEGFCVNNAQAIESMRSLYP